MTFQSRKLPVWRDHAEATMRAVLRDDGEPLGADVRADLEPRFGADLSAVRVHADEAAGASARQLGARAYTAGQHVVFRGRYAPHTAEGRALLAHEIAHTVQQRHAGPDGHAAARADAMADPGAECAARHAAIQALAGPEPSAAPAAAPVIAPVPLAIARDEGTAEVEDKVPENLDRAGSVFKATVRRDQYKTHAEAQRAQASQGRPEEQPGFMDTGFAHIEMDATSGALTIPVTVAVRHATDADLKLDTDKPDKLSATDISAARVQQIGDQYIAEVNAGLNNWFTLYVPPCQGVPWSGRELPITVRVTRAAKTMDADFTVAVSQHTGRSWVSHPNGMVLLYAGGLDTMTLRHEGAHMALGVPDEYREPDEKRRQEAPAQKSEARDRYDYPLSGDAPSYGVFSMLHERHFSFVPKFAHQVLTSLGHPECVPVLHEGSRPRPRMLRISGGYGGSDYAGATFHVEAGLDYGWMLDRERDWRAFLGVHGHAYLGDRSAYLLGARLSFEHKWRYARLGPTAEAYAEGGVATEGGAITGTARGAAPYAGVGASIGISRFTDSGEWEVKLTGGEVVRLDTEQHRAFQAGFLVGWSWWGGGR